MLDKKEIAHKMLPVLRRYGVLRASLFGSLVNGNATESSDVDIMVELPPGSNLLDLVGLKMDLEELLGVPVDVLTFNSVNPRLRPYIMDELEAVI